MIKVDCPTALRPLWAYCVPTESMRPFLARQPVYKLNVVDNNVANNINN